MDQLSLIEKRHSVRSFSDKEIRKEDLEKLLKAAIEAPTGRNSQDLYFVLVQDSSIKEKILEELGIERNFYGAKAILFTFAKNADHLNELNVGAAIENVLLEATDLGLSSCWIHSVVPTLQSEKGKEVLKENLKLEGEILPFDCVALGYIKGEEPLKKRKSGDGSKIL